MEVTPMFVNLAAAATYVDQARSMLAACEDRCPQKFREAIRNQREAIASEHRNLIELGRHIHAEVMMEGGK